MGARRPFFAKEAKLTQVHEKERQLHRQLAETVGARIPDVEVLAVELGLSTSRFTSTTRPASITHSASA
jgi:hypothetical protein